MIRTIAMILFALAVIAAIQSSVEAHLGLRAGSTEMKLDLRTGLRS